MNLNKLKGLRAENNMTQSEVAKLLNLSEQSYLKKEKGKVPFKDYEIANLCKIFNVSVTYFFEQ